MKWLYAVLIFPTVLTAQTYSACPTPGRSTLTVTAGNISTTKEITIVDIAAPAPVVDERYGYTDINAFRTSPNTGTIYANPANLQVENECGALRYTFPPRPPNTCQQHYSGYDLKFPQPIGQAFVEVWARFDTAFVVQIPKSDSTSCITEPGEWFLDGRKLYWHRSGFVFLMGRVNNNAGAFGVTMGTGYPGRYYQADIGSPCWSEWPDNEKQVDEDDRHICGYPLLRMRYYKYPETQPNKLVAAHEEFARRLMLFDGKWHRYRFWFKAADGIYPNRAAISVWVDNDHLGTLLNRDTAADKLIGLSIGRFIWHQPTKQQYVEYGRVRVWASNPGWDICQAFCEYY